MSVLKYTIPEISAYSVLSAAVETKDGYRFSFDATDPSKSYMVEETTQDNCPIFYQAMRVLGYSEKDSDASEKLRDVFVFIDFSGIFERKPVLSIISFFYAAFASNRYVALILKGMQAGVAAVIFDVVLSLGSGILKQKKIVYSVIMFAAFLAVLLLDVNVIFVILAAALLGIGLELIGRKRGGIK